MATYAAFKHIELHKVGHGKNRVPNAPRGCIGEIFGGEANASNGKNGANGSTDTSSRPRDTHSRLFGAARGGARAADRPDSAPAQQHASAHDAPANGHSNGHAAASNGHAHSNGHAAASPAKEGNPITGDGYKSLNGEINTSVTALNGSAPSAPIAHSRVPPGGYSSGLW